MFDFTNPTSWFATGSIFAAIGLAWSKIRFFYRKVVNIVFITYDLDFKTTDILFTYLKSKKDEFWLYKFQSPTYKHIISYVKPVKRNQDIVYKENDWTNEKQLLFIKRNKMPIIIGSSKSSGEKGDSKFSFTIVRGSANIDELCIAALEDWNTRINNLNNNENQYRNRYRIKKCFGYNKKQLKRNYNEGSNEKTAEVAPSHYGEPVGNIDVQKLITVGNVEFLKWTNDELGPENEKNKYYEQLAFPEHVNDFINEFKIWYENEKWFREKSVPWKRGWLLHGTPGNGKSSLVSALAQKYNVPINIFDLNSMNNQEFISMWEECTKDVPCIILIEDIDSIFDGRVNIASKDDDGLTFDCLLNTISGVQRTDGIFLIVTTNNIDKLDEALGKPRKGSNGTMISTRPGRLDRTLELKNPDVECKRKIARRILCDYPDYIEKTIEEGESDSGAQFQERCAQKALKLFWKDKEKCQTLKT